MLICLAGAVAVFAPVSLGFSSVAGEASAVSDLFQDLVRHQLDRLATPNTHLDILAHPRSNLIATSKPLEWTKQNNTHTYTHIHTHTHTYTHIHAHLE